MYQAVGISMWEFLFIFLRVAAESRFRQIYLTFIFTPFDPLKT